MESEWKVGNALSETIGDEIGRGVLGEGNIRIIRRYNSDTPEWIIPINQGRAVRHLIGMSRFSASEKSQLRNPTTTEQLRESLESIPIPTEKHSKLLQRLNSYPWAGLKGYVRHQLEAALPRFMYFSSYDRMSGEVQLELLGQQHADGTLFTEDSLRGERLFYEFLEYAGAPLGEILAAETYESFAARLQAASNNITDQVLQYWGQNQHVSVDVKVNKALPPMIARLSIKARSGEHAFTIVYTGLMSLFPKEVRASSGSFLSRLSLPKVMTARDQ